MREGAGVRFKPRSSVRLESKTRRSGSEKAYNADGVRAWSATRACMRGKQRGRGGGGSGRSGHPLRNRGTDDEGEAVLGDELNKDAFDLSDLEKSRCALLVIDILGDPEASPMKDALMPVVESAARLCAAARAAGVPVVFANDAHIPGLDRELDLWGMHGIAGTSEAQPAPQLECGEGDYVVEKRRYSGFFQTGLRLLLDELGVDTLICIGMDTNICVRHTVADAYFNNYRTVVADDATLTFLVGDQEEGLAYMETCYATKVASTDDVAAFLAS